MALDFPTQDNLVRKLNSLRNTKVITSPLQMPPILPNFSPRCYPTYGNDVLLVIPTNNGDKKGLLTGVIAKNLPKGSNLHVLILPAETGVGEQPYNDAGPLGAYNRVENALTQLHSDHKEKLESWKIGTVIVASIESFIQTEGIEEPTDFAFILFYNATNGTVLTGVSDGTPVPDKAFVDFAKSLGCNNGNKNHGLYTVGEVLSRHCLGIEAADWHIIVVGQSRFVILRKAVDSMAVSKLFSTEPTQPLT
ncbi:hypothetical protein BGZ63DRAFT_409198 [Mariannaea sp. PMI_226]|nr:hypothetical protein BGZ63DRAFT_409198 [Mariannaea sp. PMI_226]